MARVMLYISDLIVPFLIFYVVVEGLAAKRPVYDDFVKGGEGRAEDGGADSADAGGTDGGGGRAACFRVSGFSDGSAGRPDGKGAFSVGASAAGYRADVLGFSGHGAGTGCF